MRTQYLETVKTSPVLRQTEYNYSPDSPQERLYRLAIGWQEEIAKTKAGPGKIDSHRARIPLHQTSFASILVFPYEANINHANAIFKVALSLLLKKNRNHRNWTQISLEPIAKAIDLARLMCKCTHCRPSIDENRRHQSEFVR